MIEEIAHEKIGEFYEKIESLGGVEGQNLIEYFGYFLQFTVNKTKFSSRDIDSCYLACDLQHPTWTRIYLSNHSKGKSQKFIKYSRGEYRLARKTTNSIKAFLDGDIAKVKVSKTLSDLAEKITDPLERAMLDEVLSCLKAGAPRASTIMVWILVVYRLQRYVLKKDNVVQFNHALAKRNEKALIELQISSIDDFAEVKERTFIELLKAAKLITPSIQKILNHVLDARNDAAHPSTIKMNFKKTEVYIEDIIENVLLRYLV